MFQKPLVWAVVVLAATGLIAAAGFSMSGGFDPIPPRPSDESGNSSIRQNVSEAVQAQFVQALWTGDYETAKSLNEKYGLGGRFFQSEEAFDLHSSINQALMAGNYTQVVQLQSQLQTLEMSTLRKPLDQNESILAENTSRRTFQNRMRDGNQTEISWHVAPNNNSTDYPAGAHIRCPCADPSSTVTVDIQTSD